MTDTIAKLVRDFVANKPDLTVQWVKDRAGACHPVSWKMLYRDVRAFAAGLNAIGVRRGDHVGIVSDNMPEWLGGDLAMPCIGAADGPPGPASPTLANA